VRGANVVFASNTSTLPIASLAAAAPRPADVIGIHFFSPVEKMMLVEVITAPETGTRALATALDFVRRIRKTPIVVNDSRGFYTSRVVTTYIGEGHRMLAEGVPPAMIENVARLAGMPVGPLALNDEVAISLALHVLEQTRKDYAAEGKVLEARSADTVIEKMCKTLDRPGKKAGKGFYDYPAPGAKGEKTLWKGLAEAFPLAKNQPEQQELIDRMMFVQAVDAARCFEERVVTTVADTNIGSIFGWGFAPHQGGALQFINAYGPGKFVAACADAGSEVRRALRTAEVAHRDGEGRQDLPGLIAGPMGKSLPGASRSRLFCFLADGRIPACGQKRSDQRSSD
jgi:3-hydroxyacyl-CoA dehydrogenase/enoyl-CoA hydratase/3-hydroxybutyryl-CoA epimerase